MNALLSTSNNPAINLATEEYLLRQSDMDLFFLYTNSPAVIVGKHQNTLAEINYAYVDANKIPVYRRLSGGGTVYHDLQNLNFCFIQTGKKGALVDFEYHARPILSALNELGIEVSFGKRHDILIDGKKVSGNASHVFKNRVMHHGTLLYNADLNRLNTVLKTNPLHIKDKAVKSVRSEVSNIAQYLNTPLSFGAFTRYIYDYLFQHYPTCSDLHLNTSQKDQIKALSESKYSTWEWNYGYSPNYEINRLYKLHSGLRIKSHVQVKKGMIKTCQLHTSDKQLNAQLKLVADSLLGHPHEINVINSIIMNRTEVLATPGDATKILHGFFA